MNIKRKITGIIETNAFIIDKKDGEITIYIPKYKLEESYMKMKK